jgi:hypothetical protein
MHRAPFLTIHARHLRSEPALHACTADKRRLRFCADQRALQTVRCACSMPRCSICGFRLRAVTQATRT